MFTKTKQFLFTSVALLGFAVATTANTANAAPITYQLHNGTVQPGSGFVFTAPFQEIGASWVNLNFDAGNMQLVYDPTGGMGGGALISISGTALKDPAVGDEHPFTHPDGLYSISLTLGDNEVLNCLAGHCQYDLTMENLHIVNPLAEAVDIMLMTSIHGFSFAVDFVGSTLDAHGWAYGMDTYHVGTNFGGDLHFTGSTVPEPATMSLLGLGLAGVGALKRRKA